MPRLTRLGALTEGGRSQFVDGQLSGGFATALRAVLDVPPTPEESRTFRVEENHERF